MAPWRPHLQAADRIFVQVRARVCIACVCVRVFD